MYAKKDKAFVAGREAFCTIPAGEQYGIIWTNPFIIDRHRPPNPYGKLTVDHLLWKQGFEYEKMLNSQRIDLIYKAATASPPRQTVMRRMFHRAER